MTCVCDPLATHLSGSVRVCAVRDGVLLLSVLQVRPGQWCMVGCGPFSGVVKCAWAVHWCWTPGATPHHRPASRACVMCSVSHSRPSPVISQRAAFGKNCVDTSCAAASRTSSTLKACRAHELHVPPHACKPLRAPRGDRLSHQTCAWCRDTRVGRRPLSRGIRTPTVNPSTIPHSTFHAPQHCLSLRSTCCCHTLASHCQRRVSLGA